MKTIANATIDHICLDQTNAEHTVYICHRVIDTLLREDVRECVSRSELTPSTALPTGLSKYAKINLVWLKITHFDDDDCLWIPVVKSTFMQDWCGAGFPLLWQEGEQVKELYAIEDIITCFTRGLNPAAVLPFNAFTAECQIAAEHRQVSETERERWFTELRALHGITTGTQLPDWHSYLLHYDRLGAFLDHPFYPTARAKLGFDSKALATYGPEFQRSFLLHWLAVPLALYHPNIGNKHSLPLAWPTFEAVGLPIAMVDTHALIPIHPFVWEHELANFLAEAELHDVIRAPRAYLRVVPTLSVRTVVMLDTPEWHLKLPLTIRTLGAKNIRTIKPSTIQDGHSIQTLLADIAACEPSIVSRLLLTREDCGGHVDNRMFLGYILRRYPVNTLQKSTLIPVAALLAQTLTGSIVAEEAAAQFYDGDLEAFFNDYLDLTLRLHLLLWLRYGIALESNQQNSVVVLSRKEPRLRLLLKDNDSARIHLDYLARRWPNLASRVAELQDQRIVVADELPLAQMFTTITLQLNIAVLIERFAAILGLPATALYSRVRLKIKTILSELAADGENIQLANQLLLEDDRLYIKYLLIAATLAEKTETGATDVNKFYGRSAPNFLRST
ncbi:IucA/IucC family protein [Candidatus Nitrotoga sp. HW29]|uniref:IucA/IucC family protein n=1 Tax=Candidatus Nitrotoga sp. HW29 TaxID=2886963 RepID=UPI001EF38F72|nr:IucA/IucC family protein [Candidatus Nitrotoga sp. HW29]